jgi:hypothetical protein
MFKFVDPLTPPDNDQFGPMCDPKVVAIESCQNPGRYLRHCYYEIWAGTFTVRTRRGGSTAFALSTVTRFFRPVLYGCTVRLGALFGDLRPGQRKKDTLAFDGSGPAYDFQWHINPGSDGRI